MSKKWRPKCLTLDADTGIFFSQFKIQLQPNGMEKGTVSSNGWVGENIFSFDIKNLNIYLWLVVAISPLIFFTVGASRSFRGLALSGQRCSWLLWALNYRLKPSVNRYSAYKFQSFLIMNWVLLTYQACVVAYSPHISVKLIGFLYSHIASWSVTRKSNDWIYLTHDIISYQSDWRLNPFWSRS